MILLSEADTEVLIRAQDSVVGAGACRSLKERVDHPFPSGDVLLIVGDVRRQPPPSVPIALFLLINLRNNYLKSLAANLGLSRS